MFKRVLNFLFGIILLVGLISCQKKPDFEQIYNDLAEDKILQVDTSLIFAGFGVSIKDIETKVNSELGDNLYSDKEYVNRGGIFMKLNVDRTGQIRLSGSDDKLFYKVPVLVKGKILINETILGLKIRAEPGFELNLTLNLASSFKFYNDFKFGVLTKIVEIDWPRKPVIQAGPIKIDLTEAIESVLIANENFLSDVVSKTARNELKLKELVTKSASQVPRYTYIKNKDIDLWMELNPLWLVIESNPKIENDSIKVKAGLSAILNIISCCNDSTYLETDDLRLRAVDKIPENFNIEMKVNISYKSLDTLLKKEIESKGLLSSLPESITFKNLSTGKMADNNIYLAADINGKLEGIILNSGALRFDSLTNSIYLDNMKSNFYSDNWLWSILFKGFFPGLKSKIQSKLKWPLEPLLIKVQSSVMKVFARLSDKGEVELDLKNLNFKIREFNIKKDGVEILIRIEGESNFNVSV